jgi:hypothetical protein
LQGQAADDAGLEIHHHGVAEAFRHERDPLAVRRDVGALAEMRDLLNVGRQLVQLASGLSLRCLRLRQGQRKKEWNESHRRSIDPCVYFRPLAQSEAAVRRRRPLALSI